MNKIRNIVALVVIIGLLQACSMLDDDVKSTSNNTDKTVISKESMEIAKLKDENAKLSAELKLTKAELKDKMLQIQDLKKNLKLKNTMIAKLEQEKLSMQMKKKTLSKKVENLLKRMADREKSLTYVGEGKLRVEAMVLFDSGRACLKKRGKRILRKIANELKGEKVKIQVLGHTDSDPVRKTKSLWPKGNWQLSGARALEVLLYLKKKGKLNPQKMSYSAFSKYRPITSNKTSTGKAKNRRVEIVVLPE